MLTEPRRLRRAPASYHEVRVPCLLQTLAIAAKAHSRNELFALKRGASMTARHQNLGLPLSRQIKCLRNSQAKV
jgi:hypothetical protein